jgi:osmotically-inducible protein OsmY
MRREILLIAVLLLGSGLSLAQKAEDATFHAYVDSEICARLMLGPITDKRIECSKDTHKNGDRPAIVRVSDNSVFEVRNQKTVKKLVGEFVAVTGKTNEKAGKIKVVSAEAVGRAAIPKGEVDAKLIDVRNYRSSGDKVYEQVRHKLAMMPYISEFDFISFAMAGDHVILSGWTVRITNRKTAYRLVKSVEGVGRITNNIQVLPMWSNDMNIRAVARARLQQHLGRYFWGSGSAIRIIVKNGNIILLGTVGTQRDSDIAYIQCRSVPLAFHVFNLLRVAKEGNKKKG